MSCRYRLTVLVLTVAVAGCSPTASPEQGARDESDPVGASMSTASVSGYADVITDTNGGPEGFARTWWGLDRGYRLDQLTPDAGVLEADGTIADAEPSGEPLGLLGEPPVALAAPAGGAVATAPGIDGATTAQLRYVRFIGLTLREVWEEGTRQALAEPDPPDVEPGDLTLEQQRAMTLASAALLARGYSPEQVIEALALGTFRLDAVGVAGCYSIVDERPVRDDDLEGECGPVGEAAAPVVSPSPPEAAPAEEGEDTETGALDGTYIGQPDFGPALSEMHQATLEVSDYVLVIEGTTVNASYEYLIDGWISNSAGDGCVSSMEGFGTAIQVEVADPSSFVIELDGRSIQTSVGGSCGRDGYDFENTSIWEVTVAEDGTATVVVDGIETPFVREE